MIKLIPLSIYDHLIYKWRFREQLVEMFCQKDIAKFVFNEIYFPIRNNHWGTYTCIKQAINYERIHS